jgi:hypothetical protein
VGLIDQGGTIAAYPAIVSMVSPLTPSTIAGETYEDFCRRSIFGPLGIKGANIPSWWKVVAPFGGWRMELADYLKIWGVFDIQRPTLLTAATLKATLLGRPGGPTTKDGNVLHARGLFAAGHG